MDSHSTMRAAASSDARYELALEDTDTGSVPSAFAALYAAHYDFLWRCALRMGTPAADVDDLVQECFVVALRRFDRFDPQAGARASTWLFAILRNVQRNHARSLRRRAARLELISRSTSEQAPNGADAALAGRLLDDFLTTLDEDKRAAFVLAEIEGLTGPELARALELNLNTAASRVRAAKRAFREHFDGSEQREVVREQLGRSAREQAPAETRARGLPMIAALAAGQGQGTIAAGILGSKWIFGTLVGLATGVGLVATLAVGVRLGGAPQAPEPRSVQVGVAAPKHDAPRLDSDPDAAANTELPEAEGRSPTSETAGAPATTRARSSALTPIDRLGRAREALLADDPAQALSLVADRHFAGALENRRIALEVTALCRLEQGERAREVARVWGEAHRDDPTAGQLRGRCWSE